MFLEPCEVDKDIPGNDIHALFNIKSHADCQMKCQDLPECHYWTWIGTEPGANSCLLKDDITVISDLGSSGQMVKSGPKYCGNYLKNSETLFCKI